MLASAFSQSLPQGGDIYRETPLLDEALGPEHSDQLFFAHHSVAILHQRQQRVECLWGEGYKLSLPQQQTPPCRKAKMVELVIALAGAVHTGLTYFNKL